MTDAEWVGLCSLGVLSFDDLLTVNHLYFLSVLERWILAKRPWRHM